MNPVPAFGHLIAQISKLRRYEARQRPRLALWPCALFHRISQRLGGAFARPGCRGDFIHAARALHTVLPFLQRIVGGISLIIAVFDQEPVLPAFASRFRFMHAHQGKTTLQPFAMQDEGQFPLFQPLVRIANRFPGSFVP